MADRPEDRNSTQFTNDFPAGATLAELEAFFAEARRKGAPDDAHPRFGVDADGEVIFAVCLTERHPEYNEILDRNRR